MSARATNRCCLRYAEPAANLIHVRGPRARPRATWSKSTLQQEVPKYDYFLLQWDPVNYRRSFSGVVSNFDNLQKGSKSQNEIEGGSINKKAK